jgi:TolB-like protein
MGASQGASSAAHRLESWKEIAGYLKRDKRTVQRWEKEYGLPVHRLQLNTGSTVYAYPSELDAWYTERQPPTFPPDSAGANAVGEDEEIPIDVSADVPPGTAVSIEQRGTVSEVLPSAEWQLERAGEKSPLARKRVIRLQITITVASLAVVALIAFSMSRRLFRPPAASGRIRLVVLPFTNLSGDSQQDYFSAGLTDEMITQLSRLDPQRLGVIAAGSSKLLASKPLAELGRALDVQYALEGSVRRGGNQVRIDVQLIQVSDQTHLWADSYTGDLGDILHVQDQVAAAVASQIRVALPVSAVEAKGAARAASRSVNPEAYDAYLRGRFYWTNRGDLHKSIEAYEEAIRKDPQYALAYAGLAGAYSLRGQVPYDDLPPSEAKPQARDAAEHALRLDPQLAEAHAVLANVSFSYDWNFEAAEREFQRAFALDPNNPTAHLWYSHYCIVRMRLTQAQEENARTLDVDPVSPLYNTVRAEIFFNTRLYDAAIDQARRTLEQYPYPGYWLTYIWLGSSYREKKMYPEALDTFATGRRVSGDHPVMIALYGQALALSGDATGAHKALADLQRLARSRYVSPIYFAAIYLGLRENSTALDWLDKAYQERTDRLVYLGVDPLADPLRSEPRFRDLLRRVGLPQ